MKLIYLILTGLIIIVLIYTAFENNIIEAYGRGGRGGGGGRRHGGYGGRRWMGSGRGYGYGRGYGGWRGGGYSTGGGWGYPLYYRDYYQPDYAWYYPSFLIGGYCKKGCANLGNGEVGCVNPGYSYDSCIFASDCTGCVV